MGLQADLIRRFSLAKRPSDVLPALIKLRLITASFGIIGLLIHGLVGQVSSFTLLAMLFYGITLIPAGLLYSFESLGYARDDFLLMTSLRLTRIISLIAYTSVVIFSTKFIHVSSYKIAVFGLLLFPLIAGSFAFFLYRRKQADTFSSENAHQLTAWQLFYENRNLAISSLLNWLFAAAFWALCARLYGDQQMAEINVANMLTIPIALKVQVINGLFAAKRFRQINSSESDVQKKRRYVFNIGILTTSVIVIYCLVLAIPGLLPFAFANINIMSLWPAVLSFLAAQPFIAVSAYLSAEAIHARKTEILLVGPIVALAALGVSYTLISLGLLPKIFILGSFLLANILICVVYIFKLRH